MTDLLARLESAGEGSPELDGMIWCAINGKKYIRGFEAIPGCNQVRYIGSSDTIECVADVPHYTTNLQDALGLVPEGWFGEVRFGKITNWAWVRRDNETPRIESNNVATPAIALCIASLRAREAD